MTLIRICFAAVLALGALLAIPATAEENPKASGLIWTIPDIAAMGYPLHSS